MAIIISQYDLNKAISIKKKSQDKELQDTDL